MKGILIFGMILGGGIYCFVSNTYNFMQFPTNNQQNLRAYGCQMKGKGYWSSIGGDDCCLGG